MLKSTYKAAGADNPLPEGWIEHTAPTGHKYYFNTTSKQSTYTRPTLEPDEPLKIDFNATQPDHELRASLLAQDEFQRSNDPRGNNHFTGGRNYQDPPRRRGHGGDRPKSKAPIPNCAPWILVKTKFSRRFVHNTETQQSLWKFPQDVMMAVIEMDRLEWESKKKAGENKGIDTKLKTQARTQNPEPAPREAPADYDSDSYEEVEVTDDEGEEQEDAPAKRPRITPDEPEVPTGPVEFDEDDIEWQLAQMDEDAHGYDNVEEEEDPGLPLTDEDNIALFRSLLDDFQISPYATFEKIIEDNALIEDDRYTVLLNMHNRREVFLHWSRDRVAELQEIEKAEDTRKDDPKVKYLKFLQKYATPKLYWPEFRRKFKKEPEMKDYKVTDKEREKLYREYLQKMKAGQSDRRKDLLSLLKGLPKGELTRRSTVEDLPDSIRKDLRFYLLDEKKRDELVEDFIATL